MNVNLDSISIHSPKPHRDPHSFMKALIETIYTKQMDFARHSSLKPNFVIVMSYEDVCLLRMYADDSYVGYSIDGALYFSGYRVIEADVIDPIVLDSNVKDVQ